MMMRRFLAGSRRPAGIARAAHIEPSAVARQHTVVILLATVEPPNLGLPRGKQLAPAADATSPVPPATPTATATTVRTNNDCLGLLYQVIDLNVISPGDA
jgi:hypothetical protein